MPFRHPVTGSTVVTVNRKNGHDMTSPHDPPDTERPHVAGTTEKNPLLGPLVYLPLAAVLLLAAGLIAALFSMA